MKKISFILSYITFSGTRSVDSCWFNPWKQISVVKNIVVLLCQILIVYPRTSEIYCILIDKYNSLAKLIRGKKQIVSYWPSTDELNPLTFEPGEAGDSLFTLDISSGFHSGEYRLYEVYTHFKIEAFTKLLWAVNNLQVCFFVFF